VAPRHKDGALLRGRHGDQSRLGFWKTPSTSTLRRRRHWASPACWHARGRAHAHVRRASHMLPGISTARGRHPGLWRAAGRRCPADGALHVGAILKRS